MSLSPLPSSRLAATIWRRGTAPTPWVYFQTGNHSVAEHSYDYSRWGHAVYANGSRDIDLRPRAGSAIAALYDQVDTGAGLTDQRLRIYSQATDGVTTSRDSGAGGWCAPHVVYHADTISDIGIVARRMANMTLERVSLLFSAPASAEAGAEADDSAGPLQALTWSIIAGAFALAPEVVFAGHARAAVTGADAGADGSAAYFQLRNETNLRQAWLSDTDVWSVTDARIGAPDSNTG